MTLHEAAYRLSGERYDLGISIEQAAKALEQ